MNTKIKADLVLGLGHFSSWAIILEHFEVE